MFRFLFTERSLRMGQRIFCWDLIFKCLGYFFLPHHLKHLSAKGSEIYLIPLSSLCAPYERLLHSFLIKRHNCSKNTHISFWFLRETGRENLVYLLRLRDVRKCLGFLFSFMFCLLQCFFGKANVGLATPSITPYKAKNTCIKG